MAEDKKSFEEIISQEEKNLEKILKKEGRITGEVFHTQYEFIKKQKGEKGLDAFAQKAKEMGKNFDLRTVNYNQWHPIGMRVFSWLVMIKTFEEWGREKLIESGYQAPKTSFVLKILVRYFISFEAILNKAPYTWGKHYTIGRLTVPEVDMDKKFAVIRIEDFEISPLFCIFYLGYFKRIAEFSEVKNVTIEEINCTYNGKDYHEYIVKWE